MGATNIRSLKERHAGETVYVIASGASLDHIDRRFFADKTTIAVNEAFRDWPSTYVLMHHHASGQEAIDAGHQLVTTSHDCGFMGWKKAAFAGDYFVYRTMENKLDPTVNISAIERGADDELVISACTVGEAIHFAAHLGAASIVLCGVDGGLLDGDLNYAGYNGGAGTKPEHVQLTQPLLMAVAQAIRARGVGVYSLNPFVSLELEGHRFDAGMTANVIEGEYHR